MKQRSAETEFLNVDVDIRARSGLDELLDALKTDMLVLSKTKQEACIELANVRPQSVEDAVLSIHRAIQSLPPQLQALWNKCEMRRMNIRVQGGAPPRETFFPISMKTVELLASMRAEIAFTVYGSPRKPTA